MIMRISELILRLLEPFWPALTAETALSRVFVAVLNMSYTACFVIGAVLLARFLLACLRAPKIFSYVLWAVVLFRLLCPVSFASAFSPLPSAEIIPPQVMRQNTLNIHSGFAQLDEPLNQSWQNPLNGPLGVPQAMGNLAAAVWLAGAAVILLYELLALRRLRRGLRRAAPCPHTADSWLAAGLPTAFVLGVLRPRIYLPAELGEHERGYVLLHERTHLRRGDHFFKLLAFAALLLHWFNPLVWLAYRLAAQDMEMACDEAVLRRLAAAERPDYSATLLRLAAGRGADFKLLAFSEGDVRRRIKNALNYRKPGLWLLLGCVLAVALLALVLAGNPATPADYPATAEQLAENFMQARVDELNFAVAAAEITRLDKMAEFTAMNGLDGAAAQVWRLEYRLRPVDMAEVNLIDFRQADGWITESDQLGRHWLVVMQGNEQAALAGELDTVKYGVDGAPLALVEAAVRDCLEAGGYLPPETWPGNHAVVEFPLSDGDACRLLLSQPARQGGDGIWCVERWAQSNGYLYYAWPDADKPARQYYDELQAACDEGHQPWRLVPEEAAWQYIWQELGQTTLDRSQITIKNPAGLADF